MSRSSHSSNLCCRCGEEGMEGGGKREGQWRGGREKGGGKEKEEESKKGKEVLQRVSLLKVAKQQQSHTH